VTKLVLAGGTDVAEVALFDVDSLVGDRQMDAEQLEDLASRKAVIRFPTGADGGHLLHAYVDEEIPSSLQQYCDSGSEITSSLILASGRLGFGGVESMYEDFFPNPNIRADGQVPAGEYEVIGYRTEYPEDLVGSAIRQRIGTGGSRLINSPGYLIPVAFVLTIVAFNLSGWIAGVSAIVLSYLAFKLLTRSRSYQQLNAAQRAVEMDYPSIVVAMRSKPTR
jgi:hypothetical protein